MEILKIIYQSNTRMDELAQEIKQLQIILDTFKDSRSAYMFVTNPLGAQLDQQVANLLVAGVPTGIPVLNDTHLTGGHACCLGGLEMPVR